MPRVDPAVAVHRLYVDSDYKPIKQKKRAFSEEKGKAIREVVDKLLGADAILELLFPTRLANMVLVPKPNGTWWMCTYFTKINKASPKDCYLLALIGWWILVHGAQIVSPLTPAVGAAYHRDVLHLYLAVSEFALSSTLIREIAKFQ
ncbi:hypothetical protein LIER_40082 [Lithospermum erythrorhizon]|uniref:Uncharacterized protein n=1 Tax=Lithospermum erythrorhizon TaxID=34254 RepID=A0AAV3QQV3_LITER